MAVRIEREEAESRSWLLASGPPSPALNGLLREYEGYVERSDVPTQRRQVPGLIVPLIIPFGPELEVAASESQGSFQAYESGFVAGLADSFAITRWTGLSAGIQVDFSPIVARALFGLPMSELTNRVVSLEDVFGAAGRGLAEEVRSTSGWQAQFDVIDHFLARRLRSAEPPPKGIVWAWQRLVQSAGRVPAAELARGLGWSHRRLIEQFRDHIGLPPKTVARLVRFSRVNRRLQSADRGCWAAVAVDCGYYDQSHLARDVTQFTGSSPREYLRRLLPGSGVLHD